MPINHQIDPTRREIAVLVSGAISDDELLDAAERILDDPLFPPAPRVLWDAREREDVAFANVIEPLLDLLRKSEASLQGGRCALVTENTASFGMQRMFTFRSDSLPLEVRAFRDLDEARNWLEGSTANGAV